MRVVCLWYRVSSWRDIVHSVTYCHNTLLQAQYGYIVVQMLMNHLDDHSKQLPRVKASIVNVLSETVLIAAGGSVGTSCVFPFFPVISSVQWQSWPTTLCIQRNLVIMSSLGRGWCEKTAVSIGQVILLTYLVSKLDNLSPTNIKNAQVIFFALWH